MRIAPQNCQETDDRSASAAAATGGACVTVAVLIARSCPETAGASPPRPPELRLAGDLLDAAVHLVNGLVDGHLLVDDAVCRLRPDVLVVEDRELVVLRELEGHGAVLVLVVDRPAVRIGLPERLLLRRLGHREPAAESALDVRRQVLL